MRLRFRKVCGIVPSKPLRNRLESTMEMLMLMRRVSWYGSGVAAEGIAYLGAAWKGAGVWTGRSTGCQVFLDWVIALHIEQQMHLQNGQALGRSLCMFVFG